MRKYLFKRCCLAVVFFLLYPVDVHAMTFGVSEEKSLICQCLGRYGRVSFEVVNGGLSNAQVVNSSSDKTCDRFLISQLSKVTTNHPNGTEGVGVIGYSAKNKGVTNEQCMDSESLELDNYWFVEDVVIEIEKVNEEN